MSKYQELVKSFDNIRKISQDFFIYGFNGRGDFPFISERMYDNELRRIKSYLKNYVKMTPTKDKKTISISSNTINDTINPLFPLFLGKSFTTTDCFLHFSILDILADNSKKTLNEISLEIVNRFEYDEIDVMTIRNKLHEYSELGIILIEKESNHNVYSLQKSIKLDENLVNAIIFFQNILPAGYIMEPVVSHNNSIYYYKQIFFGNILDDEYVLTLLNAIRRKEKITIKQRGKRHELTNSGLPIGIFQNMITGRRYLKLIAKNDNELLIRIDKIDAIYFMNEIDDKKYSNSPKLSFIDVTIYLNEDEMFVLDRIKREVGSYIKINDNLYSFRIYTEVLLDVVPYIRTYFGRIVGLECDDKYILNKMKRDLFSTLELYEEGELNVS